MKSLEDMTEPELKELCDNVCKELHRLLPPNTGFVFLASTFGGKIAQYASNVRRDDAAKWMIEAVERWKRNDVVVRVHE